MPNKPEIGWEAKAIHASFDSAKIQFKDDRATVLEQFKSNGTREVIFEDGQPFTRYDGEILPLADALLRYGIDNQDKVDRRTLPRDDREHGRPSLASKADYQDAKSKSAFIAQHGIAAWESLPLKAPATSEVRFREDFFALSTAEKTKRIAANPNILAELPSKPRVPFAEFEAARDRAKTKYQLELDRLDKEQFNQG